MSTDHPDAGVGSFRAAFTKPFRWELRPGDPLAGVVERAGEADTEDVAREALAGALVTARSLPTWLEATGSVYAAGPDGSVRELERVRWRRTAVPLGAALAVVTGRRVGRAEHEPLAGALLAHLARGHCPTDQPARLDPAQALSIVRARAGALFPMLAGETGAELDAAPTFDADPAAYEAAARAWLAEREAQYGPTVPLRLPE